MAIVGIGVDMAEVARIREAIERPRTGARFRARVFTPAEQAYCEQRGRGRHESYAARFAAKEAAMKALGTGWGSGVGWLDVEVIRSPEGRPTVVLHGGAAALARALGVTQWHLALAHTADLAIAHVVAER